MGVPPFQRFIDPLLRFLVARGGEVAVSTVYEAVADELKLSPDDRALMLPSRQQPVYRNRIGWAPIASSAGAGRRAHDVACGVSPMKAAASRAHTRRVCPTS